MADKESFADHFSTSSAGYSRYRPGYPAALFEYLAAQCSEHDAVWDCATGSGQAARELSPCFDLVLASDASFEQVRNAEQKKNIFYLNNLAEQTPFIEHCLDLITVAQALHWFRLDSFYSEVRRLLKPGGVIAVWTYNLMQVNPALDEVIWHLYAEVLGEYWPFERRLVEGGYRELDFPFAERTPPPFAMQSQWSVAHLVGYLSTWSAVKRYREAHGVDPVEKIYPALESAWGEEAMRTVHWPLSLRVGTV